MPGRFRIRPVAFVFGLLAVALASAAGASALKDVRVGPHGDYTRVVLETDAKASYSLNQDDRVVTIELQASATAKAVAAKSQQLSWVRVEPAGSSSIVRIELKAPARVKQMVLTGPHRIVLDVYASGASAPRPSAQPAPVAPVERKPIAELAPIVEPPLAAEDALLHEEANSLLGPDPSATQSDQIAAAEGAPEAVETSDSAAAGEELATQEVAPEPKPEAAPIRVVQRERSVMDWLKEPWVLGLATVVMLGLVVILLKRRPSAPAEAAAQPEEPSAGSLFASEPAPAAPLEAEPSETQDETLVGGESAAPQPTGGDEGATAFDFESTDSVEPEKPDIGPARGALVSTIGAVTSTAAFEPSPPIAGGLNLAELERRLSLLEQRLEEVIDAKDRLERQVSAQTEELRVQRAAIARTQRVLRTVVRPEDDQPSEPVLKT